MRMLLSCCALLSLPLHAERVQTHPLVGQWTVSAPTQVRGENGLPTTITLKGKLEVAARGDSLLATLQMDAVPGQPPSKQLRMAAAQRAGAVHFVNVSTATLRGNGDELSRDATTTYTFEIKDNQLVGSISIDIPGVPDIPPRALSGSRVPQ